MHALTVSAVVAVALLPRPTLIGRLRGEAAVEHTSPRRGMFTAWPCSALASVHFFPRWTTGAASGRGRAFFTPGRVMRVSLERHTGGAWRPAGCAPHSSLLADAGGAKPARICRLPAGSLLLAGGIA